jgi:hypothetical protein
VATRAQSVQHTSGNSFAQLCADARKCTQASRIRVAEHCVCSRSCWRHRHGPAVGLAAEDVSIIAGAHSEHQRVVVPTEFSNQPQTTADSLFESQCQRARLVLDRAVEFSTQTSRQDEWRRRRNRCAQRSSGKRFVVTKSCHRVAALVSWARAPVGSACVGVRRSRPCQRPSCPSNAAACTSFCACARHSMYDVLNAPVHQLWPCCIRNAGFA